MAGFGFTNDSSDESDENRDNSGNPFDFQAVFKQFSGLGLNLPGLISALSGQASPGSLSKDLIRDISKKFLSAHSDIPVTLESQSAVYEALQIADLWLNEATIFAALPIPES